MRHLIILIVLLLITGVSKANELIFFTGDFELAKEKAKAEGKLLLVDFYATWCAPCQWMDETTFSDPGVVRKINSDFMPVKINIDDFDGYALKEHYDVKMLPTVLIFNAEGKVVKRIEETLPPSKMKAILEKSSQSEGAEIVHTPNVAPESTTIVEDRSIANTRKVTTHNHEAPYKLQIGYFKDYASTQKFYEKYRQKLGRPMIVLHDYKDSSIYYRVLVGRYADRSSAEAIKLELWETHQLDSYIFK